MEPVFGILLVIIGVTVVCVGLARDLRTCQTSVQRSALWCWLICLVGQAIIMLIFISLVLSSWLVWLIWILFFLGLFQNVRWLQTMLGNKDSRHGEAVGTN